MIEIRVHNGNIEQAIRQLNRQVGRDGTSTQNEKHTTLPNQSVCKFCRESIEWDDAALQGKD